MRRVLLLGVMLSAGAAAGCEGEGGLDPAPRTLSAMAPRLTTALTPAAAERAFGAPDEVGGSGLLIYKYRVDDGRRVWLAFPGYARIQYASLEDRDGNLSRLPLR